MSETGCPEETGAQILQHMSELVLMYSDQVLTDPHLPSQFRVNRPFANLKEFNQVNKIAQSQIGNAIQVTKIMIKGVAG